MRSTERYETVCDKAYGRVLENNGLRGTRMESVNYSEESNVILTKLLSESIRLLMEDFIKIAISDFPSAKNIIKIALKQKSSQNIRMEHEENGLHVPPFMIASITSVCNLKCKGCYDKVKIHNCSLELNENQWSDIFTQVRDLGISFILLAGGEPLTKEKVIKECIKFPEIIFPIFTNGMLINKEWVEFFSSSRNIIPVISIEGDRYQTDKRRGRGVFERASLSLNLLQEKNIFYGVSITITIENFESVLNDEFITAYIDKGCRVFFFIEYIPFDSSTKDLVISTTQREELVNRLNKLRKKYKGIFIAFPGDEEKFGGCLASGRGFVHINSMGSIEACPFAPYSDVNLKDMTLKEALSSPILREIRSIHGLLKEHKGGCALFENRETVEKILNKLDI
ncbi:radical SAM protein [Tissierella sp. MSJ-40]|uniref:Radical SAM protein n=1 Tax=Tissierella simiarum TaxID=2841534 RepID=A0ABS6E7F9_9FIRM|nr:radical SAM protein [Tissierella simiarum]MBU5438855.1 radical SAM protein [Tissierella simiarum]